MIDGAESAWAAISTGVGPERELAEECRSVLGAFRYRGLAELNDVEQTWLAGRIAENARIVRGAALIEAHTGAVIGPEMLATALLMAGLELQLTDGGELRPEVFGMICEDIPWFQQAELIVE